MPSCAAPDPIGHRRARGTCLCTAPDTLAACPESGAGGRQPFDEGGRENLVQPLDDVGRDAVTTPSEAFCEHLELCFGFCGRELLGGAQPREQVRFFAGEVRLEQRLQIRDAFEGCGERGG